MALAQRYYEALLLCDQLERRGLVNLIMPESNLLISHRLQGDQRRSAIEAMNVYVRAYHLMNISKLSVALVTIALGAKLLLKIMG
ncbi:hypothetical protein IFT48_05170 [Pseudomonas fluorescens]|uniref:hypothetical protein n=1 Tax=Pseudomonas TaxID=286 RepID=UPI000F0194EF|nr:MULTISPECIES: hypothetical protein [Pseudomonas]MBD8089367.1 hypothetical protein [Pseudomonas fluorescens]MBD8615206.1 hypothetical protein [Pseudomonas putida]MBD8682140.1 hypothetical protein [Pseudomonas sp. CFBP 13719]